MYHASTILAHHSLDALGEQVGLADVLALHTALSRPVRHKRELEQHHLNGRSIHSSHARLYLAWRGEARREQVMARRIRGGGGGITAPVIVRDERYTTAWFSTARRAIKNTFLQHTPAASACCGSGTGPTASAWADRWKDVSTVEQEGERAHSALERDHVNSQQHTTAWNCCGVSGGQPAYSTTGYSQQGRVRGLSVLLL